jgi:hypothetical protein
MPAHERPEGEVTVNLIAEGPGHIIVSVEIPKSMIRDHRRLLEGLLLIAQSRL